MRFEVTAERAFDSLGSMLEPYPSATVLSGKPRRSGFVDADDHLHAAIEFVRDRLNWSNERISAFENGQSKLIGETMHYHLYKWHIVIRPADITKREMIRAVSKLFIERDDVGITLLAVELSNDGPIKKGNAIAVCFSGIGEFNDIASISNVGVQILNCDPSLDDIVNAFDIDVSREVLDMMERHAFKNNIIHSCYYRGGYYRIVVLTTRFTDMTDVKDSVVRKIQSVIDNDYSLTNFMASVEKCTPNFKI